LNRFVGPRTTHVAFLAAILTFGMVATCAVADDEARPTRHAASKIKPGETATTMTVSSQSQNGPGPMRYYGGPKSPMWRAPAPN